MPSGLSDLTPSTVEHCLKRGGSLPGDGAVASLEIKPFGMQDDGETPKGLLSTIARATCTYVNPGPATPDSFIVKLSPNDFSVCLSVSLSLSVSPSLSLSLPPHTPSRRRDVCNPWNGTHRKPVD